MINAGPGADGDPHSAYDPDAWQHLCYLWEVSGGTANRQNSHWAFANAYLNSELYVNGRKGGSCTHAPTTVSNFASLGSVVQLGELVTAWQSPRLYLGRRLTSAEIFDAFTHDFLPCRIGTNRKIAQCTPALTNIDVGLLSIQHPFARYQGRAASLEGSRIVPLLRSTSPDEEETPARAASGIFVQGSIWDGTAVCDGTPPSWVLAPATSTTTTTNGPHSCLIPNARARGLGEAQQDDDAEDLLMENNTTRRLAPVAVVDEPFSERTSHAALRQSSLVGSSTTSDWRSAAASSADSWRILPRVDRGGGGTSPLLSRPESPCKGA